MRESGVEPVLVDETSKAETEGRKRESDAASKVQMRRESGPCGAAHYIVAYGRHARPCCGKEACRTTRLNSVSYVNARAASSVICGRQAALRVAGGGVTPESPGSRRRGKKRAGKPLSVAEKKTIWARTRIAQG